MNKQLIALKMIYQSILRYLENEQNNTDEFQNLYNVLIEQKIFQDKNIFKLILYLISSIANNHKRTANLFPKIEKLLQSIKNEMQNVFSNDQIFDIFKNNKKILLFLFKEQIIMPNKYLFSMITDYKNNAINNYPSFFFPEFKSFFTNDSIIKTQFNEIDPKEFDEKRQVGENDSYISYLIRNDLIDEFIIYISKSNCSLSNNINSSIFETNKLLIDKNPTLIEYACFFGSIQIFKYLQLNGIKLTPSLCQYAIHSNNAELINLLEEKNVFLSNNYECLLESIKCHHNEITDYILLNYINNDESKSYVLEQSIKYFNFLHISNEIYKNSDAFYYLCKKDYYLIVKLIINSPSNLININKRHEKMLENKKDGFEIKLKDLEDIDFENLEFRKRYKETKTPLIAAVEKRNHKMIEILLQQEIINVNIKFDSFFSICTIENIPYIDGGEYKSILFIAAEKGYSEIVQLLINRNDININEINSISDGFILKELTALHISILNEDIATVKILLDSKNIDPNAIGRDTESSNFYERSPLVMAIEKGNSQIVHLLLSKKETNPSIGYHHHTTLEVDDGQDSDVTVKYLNPLEIAQKSGNKEIIQLIMNRLGIGETSEICHIL